MWTTPPPPPLPVDDFMHTDDYRRYLVKYIDPVSLMSLRVVDRAWQIVVDPCIDELVKVRSPFAEVGSIIVHGGNDIRYISDETSWALEDRRYNVTGVVFLLNITTIGKRACEYCLSLETVVIPEGIEIIGHSAFFHCTGLSNVTFPKSLKSIGYDAFDYCTSIEAMDFSHTLLDSIAEIAFYDCCELKSLKLPSSVESVGDCAFYGCSKLVPDNIDTDDNVAVLAYLQCVGTKRKNV